MKNSLLIIVYILVSFDLQAEVTGRGDLELGVSRDNENTNFGMGMRYNIERNTSLSQTLLASSIQLGSDSGRSLIATAAHEYQYENSFIATDLFHSIRLYSPRVSWRSHVGSLIEFDNTINEGSGEIDTDYTNADESWNFTTGPTFTYEKTGWFNAQLSAEASKQYSNQSYTDETLINAQVGKSITKSSEMVINYNYLCSQTDNIDINKSCRNEVILGLNTNLKNYGYSVEYGKAHDEISETDIYSISGYANLNSTSVFSLSAYRLIDRIGLAEDVLDSNKTTTFTIRRGRLANYYYQAGRTELEVRLRRLITEAEIENIYSDDAAIYYDLKLSSLMCSACRFSSSYEYTRFENANDQNIISLGITKNNSERVSSQVSFRRTQRTDQDIIWSINFLVSFRGTATRLANR